jgi:hypothetical protein
MSVVTDEPNPFQSIFVHFAEQLRDAPGAARLERLARTAKRIPEPVLDDLAALVLQLNDPQLAGDDIALHLIDVAFCDARYADAVEFVSALRARLARYVREPRVASDARGDFRDRVVWWRLALARAADLCKWPAVVLMEIHSNGMSA